MPQYLPFHFLSQRTDWQTPQALRKALEDEFGPLTDVTPPDHKQDMLVEPWPQRVFCNPPYGREIVRWIGKAVSEHANCEIIVLLLPARTDTAWFHDYLAGAELRFIRGRLHFDDRGPAPFPSMLAIFSRHGFCTWCRMRIATELIIVDAYGTAMWLCHACKASIRCDAKRRERD